MASLLSKKGVPWKKRLVLFAARPFVTAQVFFLERAYAAEVLPVSSDWICDQGWDIIKLICFPLFFLCFTPWSNTLLSETGIILSASWVKSTVTAGGCSLGLVGMKCSSFYPPLIDIVSANVSTVKGANDTSLSWWKWLGLLDFLGFVTPLWALAGWAPRYESPWHLFLPVGKSVQPEFDFHFPDSHAHVSLWPAL